MRLRQFVEEARGHGGGPGAVNAAVGGEEDLGAAARPRQPDMGEPPLLLEPGAALLVERALVREQAFLPAGQEHGVEFQPLGGVQGHDRDRVGVLGRSRSMTSEMCSRKPCRFSNSSIERISSLRFSSRPAASARAVVLPHLGVAELVEHDLGQLGVGQGVALGAPAVERGDEVAQRAARLGLELFGLRPWRAPPRTAGCARSRGMVVQQLQGGVAEAALGHVDDALEGEVVGRRVDEAQIGERIADFLRARRSAGRRSPDRAGRA